jgi:flagellar motor switch protein FliM
MIDRMLGGTGTPRPADGELTDIELAMTRRICSTIVEQMAPTWDDLLGLHLSVRAIETKLTNLHLAPPSEPTLTLTLEAKSDQMSATLSLAVPYRSIEQVAGRLTNVQFSENQHDDGSSEILRAAIGGVQVELRAEVARTQIALEDLLALKPGAVIALGASVASGVSLYADQVPVHRVRPGRSGPRRAVEVLERLDPRGGAA